jgi:acetoin utilization protein AcuC
MSLKVVYSEKYLDYSFGLGHPWQAKRALRFLELLEQKGFDHEIVEAPRATDDEILLVHSKEYLKRLKQMVAAGGGYLSADTPVTPENLEAAYYYVGGTIQASYLAMQGEKVVNLAGGLHHAGTNDSSGFCIFNDHAIAIRKLQNTYCENSKFEIRNSKQHSNSNSLNSKYEVKQLGKSQTSNLGSFGVRKAAVLDLDVHAGNGTQEIFYEDPTVLTVSIHQDPSYIYPGTGFEWQKGRGKGEGYNINYILTAGSTYKDYLPRLESAISDVVEYEPDIVFVVFGVDTYKKDPLAAIKLELKDYGQITNHLSVFKKKVILFAGGYSTDVPHIWYEIVSNLQ